MKLSYRGVNYDREVSFLEVQEGEIAGKYRGRDWKYRYPRYIPQTPPKLYRQYRGVAYSTCSLPTDSLVSTANRCSVGQFAAKPVMQSQVTEIHLDNMRRNLERRLKIAQESGNSVLVSLLQKESEQLTF